MKNIYKEISKGVSSVPKNMRGYCDWSGLPSEFLISWGISRFVWFELEVSDSHFDYIHMVATARLVDAFYNK